MHLNFKHVEPKETSFCWVRSSFFCLFVCGLRLFLYQRWWPPSPLPAASPSPHAGSPALFGASSGAHLSPSDGIPPWQRSPSRRWPTRDGKTRCNRKFVGRLGVDRKVLLTQSGEKPPSSQFQQTTCKLQPVSH